MKGSIQYQADRNRWAVIWYDEKSTKKNKNRWITKYKGGHMPCTAFKMRSGTIVLNNGRPVPDKDKCKGYELARKLRSLMQGRAEQAKKGECVFRIEEFTQDGWTDTIEYYHTFINDVVAKRRKPATIKAYQSYARTWIEPFFSKHPVRLHEIEHDILMSFLNYILDRLRRKNPEGNIDKTALNIMSTLKKMMLYARRSKRISVVPPFPTLEDYNLQKPEIQWLTREEWDAVYNKLPGTTRPIFHWVYLHYRRLGEACALHKIDYDPFTECFKVHRAISARQLVNSVKTNWKKPKIHYVSCDDRFKATAEQLLNQDPDSPFLFANPRARKKGRRYTLEALRNLWYQACDDAGVRRIWTYQGLKHTACTNFIEEGGSIDDLQILTDHATRKSVEQYAEITMDKKRQVQEDAIKRQREARKVCVEDFNNVIKFPGNGG